MTAQTFASKNLDIEVLRACAITITVVAHLGVLHPSWYSWSNYFWLGGGVDLFFAISGLLITGTLLKACSQGASFCAIAGPFWVRRIFRLWPAALFWSSLTLGITYSVPLSETFAPATAVFDSWLYGALNLQNIHIWLVGSSGAPPTPLWHYWSLSLEEQFYVLLPIALALISNKKLLILPALALALLQSFHLRPWGSLLWFIRSDALLYGVIIALLWHHYGARLMSIFTAVNRATLSAVFLLSLPLPVVLAQPTWFKYYMGFVALSASWAVLVASANLNLSGQARRLQRIALYVGARSYSIYLVHNPVLAFTREAFLARGTIDLTSSTAQCVSLLIALSVTLLLADLSYRMIETPLRTYGTALSRAMAHRPSPNSNSAGPQLGNHR